MIYLWDETNTQFLNGFYANGLILVEEDSEEKALEKIRQKSIDTWRSIQGYYTNEIDLQFQEYYLPVFKNKYPNLKVFKNMFQKEGWERITSWDLETQYRHLIKCDKVYWDHLFKWFDDQCNPFSPWYIKPKLWNGCTIIRETS